MSEQINLPKVILQLINSQNEQNSFKFTENFADKAIVYDEGKEYHGKAEIKHWNEETNQKYKTKLEPIDFLAGEKENILTTMVSGNFPGSPIQLKYYFMINDEKITQLNIRA